MEFCPFCSNCLLLFNGASEADAYFKCKTCPYTYPVKEDIVKTKKFKGKIPVEVQKIVDLRPTVKGKTINFVFNSNRKLPKM